LSFSPPPSSPFFFFDFSLLFVVVMSSPLYKILESPQERRDVVAKYDAYVFGNSSTLFKVHTPFATFNISLGFLSPFNHSLSFFFLLVVDCDGVLWQGSQLLPGARDFLKSLSDQGKQFEPPFRPTTSSFFFHFFHFFHFLPSSSFLLLLPSSPFFSFLLSFSNTLLLIPIVLPGSSLSRTTPQSPARSISRSLLASGLIL